ncbi:MAG: hypothetical protein ACNA7W_18640, partial [Pseudomonadales bacterium]
MTERDHGWHDHRPRHGYTERSGADRAGEADAPRSGDFQASVARLERAVQDLVATARERLGPRAAMKVFP